MSPDIAASVRARLLRSARERREEFELTLVRFAIERFLYRLGASPFRDRCILKGAALLTLWMRDPYRPSRDIDLLAFGADSEPAIREIVTSVCAVPCPDDGLVFDTDALEISVIRETGEYHGRRALFRARLGTAQIRVQVDFAFGDAVVPPPEDVAYPTMLGTLPAPQVRAYPRVVSVAEKFEAAVKLGRANSRMKDFHDLWALSSAFPFDGPGLRAAIEACFERRGTPWTAEQPDVFTLAFYDEATLQGLWTAYTQRIPERASLPARFAEIGERIIAFLGPIRDSIVAAQPFARAWPAGGPWQ